MKPSHILALLLLSALCIACSCSRHIDRNDSDLQALDRLIEQKSVYAQNKIRRVEGLLQQIDTTSDSHRKIELLKKVHEEYFNYDIDSAFFYARQMLSYAEQQKDSSAINEAQLYLARTFFDGGFRSEAARLMQQIDTTDQVNFNRFCYFSLCSVLMRAQRSAAPNTMRRYYTDSIHHYDRLMLLATPEGSIQRKRLIANACDGKGKTQQAIDMILPEYEMGIEDIHMRALVAYSLSKFYDKLGNTDKRRKYLIQAASYDLQTPVREGLAMYDLANLLFVEGDVARANRYINSTMEDAIAGHFRMRVNQTFEMVRRISDAYIISVDAKRRMMNRTAIIVSLLGIVLLWCIVTILIYYRKIKRINAISIEMNHRLQQLNHDIEEQNEHIRRINGKLCDANNIKDEYVGHYLIFCSQQILKINDYRKYLLRISKKDGATAMLQELRTKNPADMEYKTFLTTFDESFLRLFPDFVEHVNDLMVEEARFIQQEPQRLNTELRILALIRLGVINSTNIAAILNCSLATIHTYRARLRNAALGDRNAFDNEIRRVDMPEAIMKEN